MLRHKYEWIYYGVFGNIGGCVKVEIDVNKLILVIWVVLESNIARAMHFVFMAERHPCDIWWNNDFMLRWMFLYTCLTFNGWYDV